MKLVFFAIVPALLCVCTIDAHAQTSNLFRDCWQKLKVGDSATLTSDVPRTVGQTAIVQHSEMTRTVESVTPNSVAVKIAHAGYMRAVSNGARREDKPATFTQQMPAPADPPGMTLVGTETVNAMGRAFQTQVYRLEANGAKLYMSEEVPFCTVKMEMPSASSVPSEELVITAYHHM